MDRHLRGYFSPAVKLLEIDSILFEKAVGTFDRALAARLFVIRFICLTDHHTDANPRMFCA